MFNQIKGQEKALKIIENLIKSNRFPHSLLFYGPQGVGKYTIAKQIAKYFNCLNTNPLKKGYDNCTICDNIEKEIYPDLVIESTQKTELASGEIKESKMIKVEQIRNIIRKINFKPVIGNYKFFIVDGADLMNNVSENAFLKTLEEPLPNNYIFLITHNINTILPTILSRCIKIQFDPLNEEIIQNIIKEKFNLDDETAQKISLVSNGSITKAKYLIENNMYETIFAFFNNIMNISNQPDLNISKFFNLIDEITDMDRPYIEILLDFILLFLNESFLISNYEVERKHIFRNYLNLKNKNINIKLYNEMINEIIKARYHLTNTTINLKLLLENLIINIRKNIS